MISLDRFSRKAAVAALLLVATAHAEDRATTGTPVPVYMAEEFDVRQQNFESLNILSSASDQIRQILELESRATRVDEAIRIKTQGLQYVRDLEDFDHLCHIRPNASDTYKEALGNFITSYLGNYLTHAADLHQLARFEARCTKVDQAFRVKELGLSVASSLDDFELVCRKAFHPGSDSYNERRAQFIAYRVGNFVRHGDRIETLLTLEGVTTKVDDAMSVKRAGLQAVTSIEDYERLVSPAFSNPSETYRSRRISFMVNHIAQAVQPNSSLRVILALEAQTGKVDDAMAIKRAGLAAVHNLEQFLELTRHAFSNPSESYRAAVSRFIASYGSNYRA